MTDQERDGHFVDPPIVNAPYRFWGGLVDDVRAMREQRDLLRSFVVRELRQRYKGSFLGWGWALVRPLVMLAVYGLAAGVFLGANKTIPQFAVYLYVGLVAWGYFATIIQGCILALPSNAGLINKAAFQKELLLVAVVVVALVDLVIQGSVLFVGYLAYSAWPPLTSLWWLVPGVVTLTLVGAGLGLALAAANVYFRDVGYLTDVGLQVGFWLVPVIYSYEMVARSLTSYPQLLTVYSLNPAVPSVNAIRLALWPAASDDVGRTQLMPAAQTSALLAVSLIIGGLLVWLGQRYFARVSGSIAQEL